MPTTIKTATSATLWATTAAGWRRWDRRTAMPGPYGDWPRCWAGRGTRGCAGRPARLFERTLPAAREFDDLRPVTFTLIALHDYLRQFPGDRAAQEIRATLGRASARSVINEPLPADWNWFEDQLTYANASLPHALAALRPGDAAQGHASGGIGGAWIG